MRWCISKSATILLNSRPRSDAATSRCFRHRSPAATAISNSSSARAVVERLVIDHVGNLGDGVAVIGGHKVYVPYTLGDETVEVAAVPGHPDRRRLLAIERASLSRITTVCLHFGCVGRVCIKRA